MARTYWPGENPVGKRFISGPWGPNPNWSTVIGVVGDVKQFGLDSDRTNDVYFLWYGGSYFTVRTSSDPLALAGAVRGAIHGLDPAAPVSDFRSMEQVLDETSASRRFTTLLLSIFAARRTRAGRDRNLRRHVLVGRAAPPGDRGAYGIGRRHPRDLRPDPRARPEARARSASRSASPRRWRFRACSRICSSRSARTIRGFWAAFRC